MPMELEVDAVCGTSCVGFDFSTAQEESQSTHFYQSIFVPPYYPVEFKNEATLNFQTQESLKAAAVAKDRLGITSDTSYEVDLSISWGPDGTTYEVGGSVTRGSPDGNYVEATGSYNSDGTGEVHVRGGHNDD